MSKENEPIMARDKQGNALTLGEQVESLERGYADLLHENKELSEQQDITRQAYQNLLEEKDATISGLDDIVQEKLKEIQSCNEIIKTREATIASMGTALAQAKECNDRLDHRLERQNRRSTASVQVGGGDPGLSHPYEAHDLGRIDDMAKAPIPPTFGDVQLAKSIYYNPYHMAIRQLLTFEGKRILDVLLKLDGVSD